MLETDGEVMKCVAELSGKVFAQCLLGTGLVREERRGQGVRRKREKEEREGRGKECKWRRGRKRW